ncbi:unnamed protein product [Prorocentrum cordatum]|uniref:Uncharacterized protein n=1 Tax=Prorocentrum cordatum TaxID=2364126 RepID=A0ABN9WAX4_9DINO|nr:unnamed protein product [Polarella glacialis]
MGEGDGNCLADHEDGGGNWCCRQLLPCRLSALAEDWHQAGIILIDASGYSDGDIRRFAEGLDIVRPGTRVGFPPSPAGPLARDPRRIPPGRRFSLARSALYRSTTSGNSTVFILAGSRPEVPLGGGISSCRNA